LKISYQHSLSISQEPKTTPLLEYFRAINLTFNLGSVYFATKMLAATAQLELLFRQSKIRSRGITQFE